MSDFERIEEKLDKVLDRTARIETRLEEAEKQKIPQRLRDLEDYKSSDAAKNKLIMGLIGMGGAAIGSIIPHIKGFFSG